MCRTIVPIVVKGDRGQSLDTESKSTLDNVRNRKTLMKSQRNSPKVNGRSRLTWLTYLSILPIAIGLIAMANYLIEQRVAARQLAEYHLQKPANDAWMEKKFRESTHTDGTAAWSRIILLCSGPKGWDESQLPVFGEGTLPIPLRPGAEWEEHEQVEKYLAEMQPAIDLIYDSIDVEKPVWQPIQFNGVATPLPHLQTSRSISRLLHLEAADAIYDGDSSRAMAAIRGLDATAQVFDWNLFLVGEMIQSALRWNHYHVIEQSLAAELWSSDQLLELAAMIETPMNINRRWREIIISEQMFMTSHINGAWPATGLLLDSNDRLLLQRDYDAIVELGNVPLGQLSTAASGWERSTLSPSREFKGRRVSYAMNVVRGSIYPAIHGAAKMLEHSEYHRRMVLTAVAVKRFELMHQRWPTDLGELSDVGLSQEVWNIPGVGQIQLEVKDDKAVVSPIDAMGENSSAIEIW